jgi:putative DNA methylase
MDYPVISPKKLIEVALPLDAINVAAAKEKSIRHGHPSTLHLWWARRPLAAARAVIFSQLVNDPEDLWLCQNPGVEPNKQTRGHWTKARARLFKIIEDLVLWENTTNEEVLEKAREEIRKSWREVCGLNKEHPQANDLFNPDKMPGLHDPFAGGGTIPLEAQRLGLEAHASDLNPVAVLINKAMIEIPPKFAGMPPVNPSWRSKCKEEKAARVWQGAEGLAEDVRFYSAWMRDEAVKRIGHLYPTIEITDAISKDRPDLEQYLGKKLNVVAWLWVRTVKSPNPAFSKFDVPLASTFLLSSKSGRETWIEPVINGDLSNLKENRPFEFRVRIGSPPPDVKQGTKIGRGGNFRCLLSGSPIPVQSIRDAGKAGAISERLLAIVVEGKRGRLYLSPSPEHELLAKSARATWRPDLIIPENPRDIRCQLYGLTTFGDLFSDRQLIAMTTFSDLTDEAAKLAGSFMYDEGQKDVTSCKDYENALAIFLAFAVNKVATRNCTQTTWYVDRESTMAAFSRQAIAMTWDFVELNPLLEGTGSLAATGAWVSKVLEEAVPSLAIPGSSIQRDAQSFPTDSAVIISTDPPYYDNIAYADLSDFFYVWLRKSLKDRLPELFATLGVPKSEELIASPYRHASPDAAEKFFLQGMTDVMHRLAIACHPAFPISLYYAFKQSETSENRTNSPGWETFLEAIIRAGFGINGTWPVRTEQPHGLRAIDINSLASSIVLACRPRSLSAHSVSRREFIRELNTALPIALDAMTRESEGLPSPVAPVDLSQAIIGPGMAIFSKYAAVLEADGTPMTVRTALQLINRFLAEDDFDADTQFCLHWFEQYGWESGKFGEADVLARSKGTSVDGVKQAGVLHAVGGNVRLLKWVEYPNDWDPQSDQRLPIWEVLHQLIRVFNTDGESGAAAVFAAVQSKAEAARQLAYRLYTLCERKNWAEDARAYNEVVTSWSGIESAAAKEPSLIQRELFDN